MPVITFEGVTWDYVPGPSLLDLLRRGRVKVESPCGGKGTCGKCRVLVNGGGPISEEERTFLTDQEIQDGVRLACLCYPQGDLEVRPYGEAERGLTVLEEGDMPPISLDPAVSFRAIKLPIPTLRDGKSLLDHLRSCIGVTEASLSLLRRIPQAFRAQEVTAVSHQGRVIDLIPSEVDDLYGLAVDVGTTTVVVSLVSLSTGKVLGSAGSINPQKDFGLDVISRIHHADSDGGLEDMRSAIVTCLNGLVDQVCVDANVSRDRIYEMAVGCNATMESLLLGIHPGSLGKAPFSPVVREGLSLSAEEVGLTLGNGAMVYCLPGVSAYIGSDIVAGMLVTELEEDRGIRLFIDIGTNGEIVLSINGELSSCSCAAGPALEGMNISCGMRASEGAVESVSLDGSVSFGVIGGVEAVGLCGSGILDVLSEVVRLGMVGKTGRLKEGPLVVDQDGARRLVLQKSPPIEVTQGDIRQVQLARGAILSGFLSLLEAKGLTMDDLDQVLIAGQFGRHLSVESLTGSGLIPKELKDRIRYCGNTSRTGSMMCLLSRSARKRAESLAGQVDYLELSVLEGYDRLFARCLQFEVSR
ncbi:ASKHA domain-containing protein [Dethiosulfovibrio salsuginis]|uniref:Uncharacterized 2Fe-2 and 4Fe-4S clusters-containing protein, contains DUF4445 domain n=1 Tax=Dethiosulfovibrio salsuginis TaxID=561720 RepID=A0A1X7IHX7_9BACT|nr:ASKHA domain-containing protein [Dethiosulfovibrio salsuginis]SMG14298.1 Uncharacterized 2Fe-2 and 4Fe-4S clusters-containing protein, contains DUF4445 domain [Dethiosulfovibrio salsuginis]